MNITKKIEFKDALLKYLSEGKVQEGIDFFKANSNEITELVRLECLGNISFYQRNISEAVKFYEAATTLSPEHVIPRFLYLAGVKNEREGNVVDAFKFYQAAIGEEPTFVDAYVELGGLLMKIEDFEGALKCYEDAILLDPQELSNHENLKAVLIKLNQIKPGNYEEKLLAAKYAQEQIIIRNVKSKSITQQHNW